MAGEETLEVFRAFFIVDFKPVGEENLTNLGETTTLGQLAVHLCGGGL